MGYNLMKVVKNYLWNAGYQVFILIVPLVTIPYITRVLGPSGVGVNSYTNSIVQYFILFGSLGLNIYGNREIAYHKDDVKSRSSIFWELTIIKFLSISIAMAAYLLFIGFSDRYRIFFLIQGIMLIGTATDISWFFQGMEDFKVTVTRSTLVRILSLVLTFVFVKTSADTWMYILILAVSQTLGYLTLWPYLRGRIVKVKLRDLHLKPHIKPAVQLLIPQVATQVYLQLNKTMLGSIDGVSAAGFYDNSDKIIKLVLAFITATGTVLLPHVANNFAKGNQKAVRSSLQLSMHLILVVAFPMAAGVICVAQPFTNLFFGPRFAVVATLMSVESVVIILIGISNAVGQQYLLPTGQYSPYTTSVVLGSIANIILNIPLIIYFGVVGSVVATVVSEAVVTGYQVLRIRQQIRVASLFSETWKYASSSLVMLLAVFLIRNMGTGDFSKVVIRVITGVIVYSVALLLLRPNFLISQLGSLRARFVKR